MAHSAESQGLPQAAPRGDEQPSAVVAGELTSTPARDASRGASLVGQIERPIASATADAAYGTGAVSKTLEHHRAHRSPKVLIPPRKGAQRARDRTILAVKERGRRRWKQTSGDHGQARVEHAFFRDKSIIGDSLRACSPAGRGTEVDRACNILNQMTGLGRPMSYRIGR